MARCHWVWNARYGVATVFHAHPTVVKEIVESAQREEQGTNTPIFDGMDTQNYYYVDPGFAVSDVEGNSGCLRELAQGALLES